MLYRHKRKHMKNYFFLFCISSLVLFGQNPDGKFASVHLSPAWMWGSTNYSRTTINWYPPTQASPEQSFPINDAGQLKNPIAFGFQTMIKIPTTSYLTVSLGYSFDQRFEEFNKSDTETKYYAQYWKMNGTVHSMNVTLSIYNLFSVYQGD